MAEEEEEKSGRVRKGLGWREGRGTTLRCSGGDDGHVAGRGGRK